MTLANLFRAMAWAAACAFLVDILRRCWVVAAPSIGIVAALALLACLWSLVQSIHRCLRKRLPADFVRPNPPGYPDQPKRPIR